MLSQTGAYLSACDVYILKYKKSKKASFIFKKLQNNTNYFTHFVT